MSGVIGSKRSASSAARGASPSGSARSAAHWSGCAASSRTAWASWLWVVSTPPTRMFSTRFSSSTSDEPVALLLGGDERRDEVVGRRVAPAGDQRPDPGVELGDLAVDRRQLLGVGERDRVELALDPHRPVVQPRRRRASGAPITAAIVRDGYGLASAATKSHAARGARRRPQVVEDLAHRPAGSARTARGLSAGLTRPRRRAWSSPLMLMMLRDDLLVQRAVGDAEELREQHAREDRRPRAQELLARRAVEHDRRRAARGPATSPRRRAVRASPRASARRAARGRRGRAPGRSSSVTCVTSATLHQGAGGARGDRRIFRRKPWTSRHSSRRTRRAPRRRCGYVGHRHPSR